MAGAEHAMLGRLWKAELQGGAFQVYERFAETVSMPMFRNAAGCVGVVMYRDEAVARVLSLWTSTTAIESFEASKVYRATVADLLATGSIARDLGVRVFKAHLAWSGL